MDASGTTTSTGADRVAVAVEAEADPPAVQYAEEAATPVVRAATRATSASPRRDAVRRRGGEFEPSRARSEEHTSELQSLMRISYAVFRLQTKPSPLRTIGHTP